MPRWYIESCQKISYMFPKAHAVAYVTMAFRIAYYKVDHPEAFYATYFTTQAADFDAHLILQGPETLRRRRGEIDRKGSGATAKEKSVAGLLEVVLEALARGISFLPVHLYKSDPKIFLITPDGLLPPLIGLQGLGKLRKASWKPGRKGPSHPSDLRRRTRLTKTVIEILEEPRDKALDKLPGPRSTDPFLRRAGEMAKIIPFPRRANPTITELLQEFLTEQHRRVKPPTGRKYERIVYLLMDSLDTFGPDDLPPAEKALYNRLFQQGKMQFL